jgi:hypothetical protein
MSAKLGGQSAGRLLFPGQLPVFRARQQSGWIEVFGGERSKRRRSRRMQPHLECFSILKRRGSAGALIRCSLDRLLVALPQPQQHGLDMLAGSQRVDGEVRTGAVVLKQPGPQTAMR